MSKTLDEKQQFIELRAKGYSFQKISDELKISKPTLIEWSKNTNTSRDIQNYRTLAIDDLQERYSITRRHRIALFGEFLARAKQELSNRDLKDVSTDKLICMIIKLNDSLRVDEQQLELIGEEEFRPLMLTDEKTWKI